MTLSAVLFLSLQLSAEIALSDAFRFVALTCALSVLGTRATTWALPNLHLVGRISLGTTLAIVLWTLLDQILRPLGIRTVLTPSLLYCALALVILCFSRRKSRTEPVNSTVDSLEDPLFVALCSLLLLSQTWSWLRWSALVSAATIALYLWGSRVSLRTARISLVIGFLMAAIGMAIGIVTRRTDWWLPGYGMDELEYLSNAAYSFGPRMDVLVANEPMGYQWFGFAILGLFEHAAGVADFVVGTRFDFILSAALSAALVLAISCELVFNRAQARAAAFLACAMTTTMFYPNPWGIFVVNFRSFGSVALLGIVLASLGWIKHQFSYISFVPLAVLCSAFVTMKTAALVPVGVALGVGVVFGLVRGERRIVLPLIGLGIFLVVATLLTVRGGSGMQFSIRQPFVFMDRFWGYSFRIDRLASISLGSLRVLLYASCFLASLTFGAVATAWWWAKYLRSWWVLALLAMPVFVGIFFATFTSRVSDTHMHFLQVPVTAMFPLLAVAGTHSVASTRNLSPFARCLYYFIPGIAAVCVSVFAVDSPWAVVGLDTALAKWGVILFCLVVATFLVAAVVQYPKLKTTRLSLLSAIVGGVVIFMSVLGLSNSFTLDRQGMYDSGIEENVLGSPSLQRIGLWLQDNTQVTDVLATNLFAPEGTSAADSCAISATERNRLINENLAKSNFFTLLMFSKRRFVVAAPNHASILTGRSLINEVRSSVNYGCEPTFRNRVALKNFGADWYVAYLPTTKPAFQAPDQIAFQSGYFYIVRLG